MDLQLFFAWLEPWALSDYLFHLLSGSRNQSLSQNTGKLLTGYVVKFNCRNKRYGHLFQTRYKSVLREEDPYLLELTGYIYGQTLLIFSP